MGAFPLLLSFSSAEIELLGRNRPSKKNSGEKECKIKFSFYTVSQKSFLPLNSV